MTPHRRSPGLPELTRRAFGQNSRSDGDQPIRVVPDGRRQLYDLDDRIIAQMTDRLEQKRPLDVHAIPRIEQVNPLFDVAEDGHIPC